MIPAALHHLPWQGDITAEPLLGGLSNESWKVTDARGSHVVRFGRDFPFHHVDRARVVRRKADGSPKVMAGIQTTADVDLPASTSTSDMVFRLTVTDSVGETHSSYTAIRVLASGDDGSSPSAVAGAGSGGTTLPTTNTSTGGTETASVSAGGGGGGGGASTLPGLLGLALILLAFKRAACVRENS